MKIHHLNCGCMCPVGGKLLPGIFPREVICHCLLIETPKNLILIDSGFALRDIENPSRIGILAPLLNVMPDPTRTAVGQIRAAGFSPDDVTDVIPTHLDSDHAGGIEDLPNARVHVSSAEYHAAFASTAYMLRTRYKSVRFTRDVRWQIYEEQHGQDWNGFECASEIKNLPREITLVKLPGHTPGHFGVAVEVGGGKTLLHAGDAYYDQRELSARSNFGLSLFQRVAHVDYATAMKTQTKLKHLKKDARIEIFCAHDSTEFKT